MELTAEHLDILRQGIENGGVIPFEYYSRIDNADTTRYEEKRRAMQALMDAGHVVIWRGDYRVTAAGFAAHRVHGEE